MGSTLATGTGRRWRGPAPGRPTRGMPVRAPSARPERHVDAVGPALPPGPLDCRGVRQVGQRDVDGRDAGPVRADHERIRRQAAHPARLQLYVERDLGGARLGAERGLLVVARPAVEAPHADVQRQAVPELQPPVLAAQYGLAGRVHAEAVAEAALADPLLLDEPGDGRAVLVLRGDGLAGVAPPRVAGEEAREVQRRQQA